MCLLDGGFKMSLNPEYAYKNEVQKIIADKSIGAIAVFGYKGDLEKVKLNNFMFPKCFLSHCYSIEYIISYILKT